MIDYIKVFEVASELYGCIKTDVFRFILKKINPDFDEDSYYEWINENIDIENEIFKFEVDGDDLYIIDKLNNNDEISMLKNNLVDIEYFYPSSYEEFINFTKKPLWQFQEQQALLALIKYLRVFLGKEKGDKAALEFTNDALKDENPIAYLNHYTFNFPSKEVKECLYTLSFICAGGCRLQKFKGFSTRDVLLIQIKESLLSEDRTKIIDIANSELNRFTTAQLKEIIQNEESFNKEMKEKMLKVLNKELDNKNRIA